MIFQIILREIDEELDTIRGRTASLRYVEKHTTFFITNFECHLTSGETTEALPYIGQGDVRNGGNMTWSCTMAALRGTNAALKSRLLW